MLCIDKITAAVCAIEPDWLEEDEFPPWNVWALPYRWAGE